MKTDNYIKVLLTSIVILLGVIVVKDIDLAPKAHADLLGTSQKYQIDCLESSLVCAVLNTDTGISKLFFPTDLKPNKRERGMMMFGEKPDF